MRRLLTTTFALALAACNSSWNPLRSEVPEMHDGIKAFADQHWTDAEHFFDNANRKEPSPEADFGEGNALYKQKKTPEALDSLRKALDTHDDDLKARTYFDMGNTDAAGGNLTQAIADYRRALEIHPSDVDARYNLEWARKTLEDQKKKEQEQKSNQGKDQQKDASNDQKNQQQDQKDQKDQQSKSDQKQDQNSQQKQDEQAKNDQQKQEGQDKQQQDQQQQAGQQGQEQQQQQGQQGKDQQGEQKEMQVAQGDQGNKPLTQQQTSAILDALQSEEHSLQMWKFDAKEQHRNNNRSGLEKDW